MCYYYNSNSSYLAIPIVKCSNRGNSSVNGLRRYVAILFAVCFICTQGVNPLPEHRRIIFSQIRDLHNEYKGNNQLLITQLIQCLFPEKFSDRISVVYSYYTWKTSMWMHIDSEVYEGLNYFRNWRIKSNLLSP